MPVFLCVTRKAQCVVCLAIWELEGDLPYKCPSCGSPSWLWGPDNREGRWIRQELKKNERKINPGARSLKRQARAKAQVKNPANRRQRVKEREAERAKQKSDNGEA